jgi:phosphatidylethanolamine-binding protein (PEBP) family uncharacterized protein
MKEFSCILMAVAFVLACSEGQYDSAGNVARLDVSFADSAWDGKTVPKSGQCENCGGGGLSPALRVRNIPAEADALVAEFNDKSMPALSKDGGHGAIRIRISNTAEFVIPSVHEQTFDLPQGVVMESQHRAPLGNPGAFMAPCGCGNGNSYEAKVMALRTEANGRRLLAGTGKIDLGKF